MVTTIMDLSVFFQQCNSLDANTLFLIGPPGLSDIITIQLKHSKTVFNFPIEFNEWKEGVQELLVDLPKLTVKEYSDETFYSLCWIFV